MGIVKKILIWGTLFFLLSGFIYYLGPNAYFSFIKRNTSDKEIIRKKDRYIVLNDKSVNGVRLSEEEIEEKHHLMDWFEKRNWDIENGGDEPLTKWEEWERVLK